MSYYVVSLLTGFRFVLSELHKEKKVVVAQALSDLVIYTRSVKFISFSHSRENQNNFENTSTAEKKARKLASASGEISSG